MSKPSNVSMPRTRSGFCEKVYLRFQDLIERRSLDALFRTDATGEGTVLIAGTKGVELWLQYATMTVSAHVFRLAGGVPSRMDADESIPLGVFLREKAAGVELSLAEPYSPDGDLLHRLVEAVSTYTSDFLEGDFTHFEAARASWKQATKRHAADPESASQLTFPAPDGDLPEGAPAAERIARAFSFLAGHGFQVAGLHRGELEEVVLFADKEVEIEVRYDKRQGVVSTGLARRGPGAAPPKEGAQKYIPLSSLLYIPGPGQRPSGFAAERDGMDEHMARQAAALKRYAREVLGADSALDRAYGRMARPAKG